MNFAPSLRALGLSTAVLLASCGYSPMYAPAKGQANAAGRVQIGNVEAQQYRKNMGQRRTAQTVYQELKLNFPHTGTEMDTADIIIFEDETTLAVQKTAAIQRASINVTGALTLTDPNGKVLLKTNLSASSPYNLESKPYSTEAGKTYARTTAAHNVADEIARRLYLYYGTNTLPAGAVAPADAAEAPAK